tara:strand:- start:2440 stop:2712 length:273 start_codon:yes stop_codon:yes gene_type:complete
MHSNKLIFYEKINNKISIDDKAIKLNYKEYDIKNIDTLKLIKPNFTNNKKQVYELDTKESILNNLKNIKKKNDTNIMNSNINNQKIISFK